MCAAGNDAYLPLLQADRRAMASDAPRVELEPDQLALRPVGLDLPQGVPADELRLVELHGPAQPRLIRVDALVHVVAPETKCGFESRRVARSQSRRKHAGLFAVVEDCVPRLAQAVAVDEELESVLARVAGSRDQGMDPGDVAVAEPEVWDGVEAVARQPFLGEGALECDKAQLKRAVFDLDVGTGVVAKPLEVFLPV